MDVAGVWSGPRLGSVCRLPEQQTVTTARTLTASPSSAFVARPRRANQPFADAVFVREVEVVSRGWAANCGGFQLSVEPVEHLHRRPSVRSRAEALASTGAYACEGAVDASSDGLRPKLKATRHRDRFAGPGFARLRQCRPVVVGRRGAWTSSVREAKLVYWPRASRRGPPHLAQTVCRRA